MSRLVRLCGALALCLLPALALAGSRVDRLADALRLGEVVDILRDEGLEHGRILDSDMLEGRGGDYFAEQVAGIFDAGHMTETLKRAMSERMSQDSLDESLAFFSSDLGRRIVGLELSARVAFSAPDVEEIAQERFGTLAADDPRRQLIRDYVQVNELVPRNVDGIQSTDFQFYLGLADGGAVSRDDETYIATMMDERDALIAETDMWAMSFHYMAYAPLSDQEIQANIDYSRSVGGQAFNTALFDGFDRMYDHMFYELGRLVARSMAAADL